MYNKDSENMIWAREQMEKAGVTGAEAELIENLLDVYWTVAIGHAYKDELAQKVLNDFTDLARGHALVAQESEGVWVQARPGTLVLADKIRVRQDAYSGSAGTMHNGRVGVITAIRYGDIHVRYTDGLEPSHEFVRHSPHALEKRVK